MRPRSIAYSGAVIGEEEIRAVEGVLRGGNLHPGERVLAFERRCAALLGKRHGAMVNSGSSALVVAMRLLELPPGSEVATSVLTFSTDVSSIAQTGCVPVFADCEVDTYQVDLDALERAITPRTRALLVPNLIGGMPDWDRLRALADRHRLPLIEDSCDTLGGSLRGRPPGERADLSVTSFSPRHIITALGIGGLVAVDDTARWDRALVLRGWGRSSEPVLFGSRREGYRGRFESQVDGIDYDSLFVFEESAYGFVPSEAAAAFGLAQLDRLEEFTRQRRALFERHQAFFRSHEEVFLAPRVPAEVRTTWLAFPIQLRPETGWTRKSFQMHLMDAGIDNRVVFTGNVTRQPMMRGIPHRADPAGYPNADQIMRHGTLLPCFPGMSDDDCAYLYEVIEDYVRKMR